MDVQIEREKVKGGWISRDARSGRLVSVLTDRSESYVTSETEDVVKRASMRHQAAMERLVNR